MDKPGLRDALPQPRQSDTRNDPFWSSLDSSLSAAAAATPQPSEPVAKRDLDVGLGDVARGVGAGALDLVGGIGELARQASNFGKENAGKQGGDYLEQARANMANKLSPVLDVVAGAGDLAASGAESLNDGMSADAKEALGRRLVDETPEGRLTLGDGAGDIDVWAMKMAQGVGSLLPTLAAGGVTGVAAKASIGRAVTASMVKRGATQEVAEAVAAKAVSKIATGAAVTTGATGSVGSAGVNTRDTVLGMSFDELAGSDTFRQSFTRIDQDQQTAHLSDEEKLGLAREETANLASRATMSDAKVWGAAAMGSMMGDAMLFKMLAGKAATGGVLKGAAKGAAGEGISETLEEGVQQYAVNESLNEVAAADIDPMKGVMSSAIEGGLIGMGTGGAVGAVGGARGGKHASQEDGVGTDPVAEPSAPVTEGAAGPAVDPNFASVPLEDGEQAPSASQAEGDLNPLGPSASQFDELRDVPAYLRRDDTAARFKGMAADSEVQRALASEFGQSVQELVASQMQAGDQGKSLYERAQAGELGLDPFAGNKSAQQVAMENQRPALPLKDVIFAGDANAKPVGEAVAAPGDHDDQQAGPGPQFRGGERTRWQNGQEGDLLPPEAATAHPAGELPGAVIDGESREVGTELPHRDVIYGADNRQPDATHIKDDAPASAEPDSILGPLKTLRITRKGKPFASEKEAAMASRKGKETPVPLKGGGFGVAEIAEIEQVRAEQPTPSQPQQLAPAVDTGYRDVIPSSEQSEVTHGQPTPIPAISSERPGDQPGAGDPVATGVGQTTAELAERAGPGDPADGAPLTPLPVTQPGEENALTAPAPAGVAVSEEVQPEQARTTAGPAAAPTPWSGMIDNPDGTITLEGEVAALKSWAKDNGVKAIPGKGGLVVSTTSVAKVRQLTTPATSEPVRQIEAARAEIAPEPTEAQKEAGNYKKGHIKLQGLDIALENPKGSTRSGTDPDGKAWQSTMAHDYGYIKRTQGADGDHVDVFIGDKPDSETVYVVDQVDPKTGKFDEHKVMMGFSDEQAAREGYLGNYEAGWKGLGAIKAMPVEDFKRWVKEGDTTKPVAKKVRMSQQREGLSADDVAQIVSDFRREYKGAQSLDFIVGQTQEDLYGPEGSPEQIGWRDGGYLPGKQQVHLIADSITRRAGRQGVHEGAGGERGVSGDPRLLQQNRPAPRNERGMGGVERAKAEVVSTLRHEVLGHYGLDTFTPENKRALLQKLSDAKSEKWLAPAWSEISRPEMYGDKSEQHQAEEVFAHLTENELPSRTIQAWNGIKTEFSRMLRKAGLAKGPIKEHELDSLIRAVGEGIRSGKRTRQNIRTGEEVIGKQADEPAKDDKPERIIRFSKQAMAQGNKPAKHLTRKEAELVSHGWFKQYRGASGIKVQIHATQGELEGALGLEAKEGLIRRAAFDDDAGTLHVAADTISDPKRMREILRHEVLAHYGLANVLGDGEYTKLMSRLIQSQKDPSMKPVWDWVNTHYADEDIGTQAEEVVAHLAEFEQGAWGRGWDRVVAWVTRALRTVGFVPDGITAAETRSLIEGLGKQLQRTGQDDGGSGGKKFSQEEKPGEDTFKPYPGEAEEYRRQLGKMMASPKSGELVIEMGRTPLVLQAVGAPDLPLRITRDIVRKATNGVKHDVPMPVIEQLPELLHDPIAVFDSKTEQGAKTILIDARDASGRPIITAVHLNAKAGRIDVNRIASVYGKDNSHRVLMGWVEEGLLRYAKEKQNPLGTTQGLQLPKRGSPERVYDSNILSRGDLAKDADKVRDRVTAAGHAAPSRSEQESARDDGPFPPDGLKFSQTNSAADEALQKLNLGPKPDIIDKTKSSLNKLRQVDRGVVSSWIDRVIKKANTEVLDALAPIKYAEEAAGITDAADSGYVAARMATGAASTMQATMLYGLPEWNDGVIQRKAGTGEKDALLGIFADLGADLHNWLGWMAGHRAELLMAQGRENLLDANDIAALKGQGKGKEAKFLDAKARWNRLNAATLDLAQEAGLFTKEARAEFESEWYIPFFRESDDGDVIAPFKTKGIANQNAGIKKLKGGEANTNDLLENIFTSTSKLIDASMKNMAAQKTVWNLADTGIIEVIPKPNKMDYQALANGKDRIMVKLEGEDYMIRVEDPDLYRAMTFFDRKPFSAMVNVAAKAKRLLTAGVTASPEFMLRNFLRDSLSSWAISKDGFRPVIDSIKGVKKTLAMDGSTIDVMFSGASFLGGYVNGNDPEAMADTVRKSLRRKGMTPEQIARYEKSIIRNAAQAKGVVANVWEKYNRYGEAFENANREAVYAAAIKAGKSHAQAAFESKDLMDFSMLGASRTMQVMTQLLPFFNARVQGLGKLSRELRDNPREIAKRAGMITAASLALLALNWDDERYEKLPDWDKDANWHFWIGDEEFRIPKPFEIGVLFGTIPERMVRAMGGKDTGAQLGKAIARAVGETFALNPTPQIVKPLVESYFNYDAFRGIPIENAQDLAVQAEARYNEQTSLMMRELGETLGMSPKKLEHLLIGYTGTIGSYVMAAADGLIRAGTPGESASWRADEIPLVKAVYRGSGPAKSTQHMEEFYRMLNEVNQLKRTVDQYRSEGLTDKANELLEEQGGILKSRRSLSRTQQQVRVVRNRIELIQRDRTLTAEEKRRRIDEMLARRNDLVYQAVNKNKANWE
ncbi:LPD38 domain-containing protein [Aeromonas caviae]